MSGDGAHPLIEQSIQICAQLGVTEFVVAPGSRSAPITVALARHPAMRCRVVYDERAAGYVALGMAQQLGRAVGLVCTSGTAALNFAPAVTEAFYQQAPLLVFTADRPPEWIDQQDNQAIHQSNLYAPHVRASYSLPIDDGRSDTRWFAARVIREAIQQTSWLTPGPVHINAPLTEPLYPAASRQPVHTPLKIAQTSSTTLQLSDASWQSLLHDWSQAKRKLIIGGQHHPDNRLAAALRALSADPALAVVGDITSNLFPAASDLMHWEVALSTRDANTRAALRSDLVISFGGQVTSRAIKALLRELPPNHFWHIAPALPVPDPFQALTMAIPMHAANFFARLASEHGCATGDDDYGALWHRVEERASYGLAHFLETAPFGEFKAVWQIMHALPAQCHLQLGNSMPVRYANLIGCAAGHAPAGVFGNRGTSGIDGTVSTAVGAALASGVLTTLLVGDLGFFYDRNGLWHQHVPANLRIVVLNNHGGGIFDIIDGPNRLTDDERTEFFLTPQPLSARRTAQDHGLRYFHAESEQELLAHLPDFFAAQDGAAILEIETEMAVNSAVFRQFREMAAAL